MSGAVQSLRGGAEMVEETVEIGLAEVERRERELAQRRPLGLVGNSEVQMQLPQRQIERSASGEQGAVREEVRIAAIQPPQTHIRACPEARARGLVIQAGGSLHTRKSEAEWQERVPRCNDVLGSSHVSVVGDGGGDHSDRVVGCVRGGAAWGVALTGDAEAARGELLRLRMAGGESMDAYLQRAVLLASWRRRSIAKWRGCC